MIIKKENSAKFYRDMSFAARTSKFPLKAMFELTYKCNFRCVHCYVVTDKRKKELSAEGVKVILDQLKKAGCFHVGFTGGELFLRKDIFEILNYAKRSGFRISILTNGFLIDKERAKKIASLGTSLNRVDISVLGATKNTFEKITGKKNSFKKVMNAIRLLKKEGVDVQVKTTLLEPNKNEFLKIREIANKFDTMFRYGATLSARVDGDKAPLQYQVEPEEIYRIKKALAENKKIVNEDNREGWNSQNKNIGRKNLFRCGAGQTEISISPYGEMNLCLEMHHPEYNILKGSFEDGWKKIKKLVENIKLPEDYLCRTCEVAHFCHWCPAKSWLLKGDFTSCDPHARKMAQITARNQQQKSVNSWNKVPLKLIEDHDEAYSFWKKLGLRGRPLIHLDAHIDFNFHPVKSPHETLKEAKSKKDLIRQLSTNLMYAKLKIKEKSLTNIGNYVYPAMRDGIVNDFYWVIPGDRKEFNKSLKSLYNILKSNARRDPFKTEKIIEEKGILRTKIYEKNFIITTLEDLPENISNALLDIDTDYLTTESIRKAGASQDVAKRFPWIWPEELINRLKAKKIQPSCMTIAYSVNGGFTPLVYKFLGDELAIFLNDTDESLKKNISNKNKALILIKEKRGKASIELLKSTLKNLNASTINAKLKNRLKANVAFILFRYFSRSGNFTETKTYYNLAVKSDKTYNVKDNNYGPLFLRTKENIKKAEQEFKFILAADKSNSYALCGLADVFMKRKTIRRAKEFFKKAYSSNKKNVKALLGVSRAEISLKNYRSALKYLEKYKPGNNPVNVMHSLRAAAYEGLGEFDEALQEYKSAQRFGVDLGLYIKLFRLLRKVGIQKKHKHWIELRIKTYESYRDNFLKQQKSCKRGKEEVLQKKTKKSIKRVDATLKRIYEKQD